MKPLSREEVYKLIDGERKYQNTLTPERTEGKSHTVGNYLTMLRHYINQADTQWVLYSGDQFALDVIRKIGAICVRCMEEHGAPSRNFTETYKQVVDES